MTSGHKGVIIVQRPGLLLMTSTLRLANQTHDIGPLKDLDKKYVNKSSFCASNITF